MSVLTSRFQICNQRGYDVSSSRLWPVLNANKGVCLELFCGECLIQSILILWNMQWVGVVPHLLRHQIVDAQVVALMVIGMRLAVKVWDTNIRRRVGLTLSAGVSLYILSISHMATNPNWPTTTTAVERWITGARWWIGDICTCFLGLENWRIVQRIFQRNQSHEPKISIAINELKNRGHIVEELEPWDHASRVQLLQRFSNGTMAFGSDPRSAGQAAGI